MKGNQKLIEILNELLADELTAINQYTVHAELCENWGYTRLHDAIEKRTRREMRHAEALIRRIIFLEGIPVVSRIKKITIGPDVEAQLRNDWNAESDAINGYNSAMRLAMEVNDNGTRELLGTHIQDEEEHIDWIEGQLDEIKQMGIQNYLASQTQKAA